MREKKIRSAQNDKLRGKDESPAWEEIKKLYETEDTKNSLLPRVKEILKKHNLPEDHLLLEYARQVYEAW